MTNYHGSLEAVDCHIHSGRNVMDVRMCALGDPRMCKFLSLNTHLVFDSNVDVWFNLFVSTAANVPGVVHLGIIQELSTSKFIFFRSKTSLSLISCMLLKVRSHGFAKITFHLVIHVCSLYS